MKKLNTKGFTLIELLAVITIMGVLMLVAIPTVSRTIENTRKDTMIDAAKQYVNAVKTMWTSDSLECREGGNWVASSALAVGTYWVNINSANAGTEEKYPVLLESGGKSPWGNKNVTGWIKIVVANTGTTNRKVSYYVVLSDGTHGIPSTGINTEFSQLKRSSISTSGVPNYTAQPVYCREA